METQIITEITPNPNALKFIMNKNVLSEGKLTFKNPKECENIPLAKELFKVPNVIQIYFFENVITINQDGEASWESMQNQVKDVIKMEIESHDPNFSLESSKQVEPKKEMSPELLKIDEILDRTVRAALQGDGGDLEVISLEGNVVHIKYQGACGGCPSSTSGTLMAIEGILKDEFDPNITVVVV